jgi:hypothetical protein
MEAEFKVKMHAYAWAVGFSNLYCRISTRKSFRLLALLAPSLIGQSRYANVAARFI